MSFILDRVQQGDARAAEEFLPLVCEYLRRLAVHKMAKEAAGHTTALVREVWLPLSREANSQWKNREHSCTVAAEVVRRILIGLESPVDRQAGEPALH